MHFVRVVSCLFDSDKISKQEFSCNTNSLNSKIHLHSKFSRTREVKMDGRIFDFKEQLPKRKAHARQGNGSNQQTQILEEENMKEIFTSKLALLHKSEKRQAFL